MEEKRKTISVVTPCYNEELNVTEAYETVRRVFEEHLPGYRREHIFVTTPQRTPASGCSVRSRPMTPM